MRVVRCVPLLRTRFHSEVPVIKLCPVMFKWHRSALLRCARRDCAAGGRPPTPTAVALESPHPLASSASTASALHAGAYAPVARRCAGSIALHTPAFHNVALAVQRRSGGPAFPLRRTGRRSNASGDVLPAGVASAHAPRFRNGLAAIRIVACRRHAREELTAKGVHAFPSSRRRRLFARPTRIASANAACATLVPIQRRRNAAARVMNSGTANATAYRVALRPAQMARRAAMAAALPIAPLPPRRETKPRYRNQHWQTRMQTAPMSQTKCSWKSQAMRHSRLPTG